MERWHQAFTPKDDKFKELFGVPKETFLAMLTRDHHP
jgi:hypothetical protein